MHSINGIQTKQISQLLTQKEDLVTAGKSVHAHCLLQRNSMLVKELYKIYH